MIIDALKELQESNLDYELEWVHFGEGESKNEMEQYAQKILGGVT